VTSRLVAISPHLDDAVLGCSALLAAHPGAIVVTVFAGRPTDGTALPAWDEAAGFRAGDDVVGARRAEDRAALHTLGARPRWLDFLDAQYGDSPSVDAIVPALESAIGSADAAIVGIPLGLFHSDHALAHAAALALLPRHREWRWLAYEEPMYRRVPGALDQRRARLREAGVAAEALDRVRAPRRKRHALTCYASQLRALRTPGRPGHADALAPERYWELTM
jgi:LmbE family N-acetylglucosaminyl deacetylase